MLSHSLQRSTGGEGGPDIPTRQNRRTPLIEAAMKPGSKQFTPAALRVLSNALAMVIGTEAIVASRNVLQLDDDEASRVRRWAIRALVEAARR